MVLNYHTCTSEQLRGAVNIMRPSKWANPYRLYREEDRWDILDRFCAYLDRSPWLVLDAQRELVDVDLLCCCAPAPCHGDIWDLIANARLSPAESLSRLRSR